MLGANGSQLFFQVTLPNASPWIAMDLRIAIPQAFVGAVVTEIIASERGLSTRLRKLQDNVEYKCPVMNLLRLADVELNVACKIEPAE